MICLRRLVICSILCLYQRIHANDSCFKQSNDFNNLFVSENSLIKIPLVPFDCIACQSADEVDIQLIDEQKHFNRTNQRLKIFLKTFEIEDSSYICLDSICPILVEHGSDTILLNITSSFFSHALLSFIYFNHSKICAIETRFTIYSLNQSFTCTSKISLHPRINPSIQGQFRLIDCQVREMIYRMNLVFHQLNVHFHHMQTRILSTKTTCEYLFEITNYFLNDSSMASDEFVSFMTIRSDSNPWKKHMEHLGPCTTKIIPFREMFFTEDIVQIRNIQIDLGQTIQIQCPIDGSEDYLKYTWYYQPRYQISNDRVISLVNITEQMQGFDRQLIVDAAQWIILGRYMCIADDGYEQLEFEMILHITSKEKSSKSIPKYLIIISILLLLICVSIIIILYCLLKTRSSTYSSPAKPNGMTIHHDVMLTIRHLSPQHTNPILSMEDPYPTLEFIDDQPSSTLPVWLWRKELPYRYSIRHHNVNRQFSMNIPLIQSHSDMTLASNRIEQEPIDEKSSEMKILKITVPLLNQYPQVHKSMSTISFDSQDELEQFHQMINISDKN